MKKIILLSLISTALVGCGGGSDSNSPSSNSFDGIYANSDAVMLVDTALTYGAIASNGTHILSFDGFTRNNDSMTFKGSNLWSNGVYSHSSDQTMNALFDDNNVQTTANINGTPFTYDLSKQPVSKSLAELAGTHSHAGQVTDISEDGTFNSYGNALGCTYDGILKMTKGLYYSSTVIASGCTDSARDGAYNGYFFTVNKLNKTNLLAVFHNKANPSHIIWGETPITN
ncbi:hypothetical protein AAFX60_006885 [Aliivibrio fischeri]